MRLLTHSLLAAFIVLGFGCNKGEDGAKAAASDGGTDSSGAKDESDEGKKDKRKRRKRKDRGEASMTFGGQDWQASRASARLYNEGNKLKLSIVKSDYSGGKSTREQLTLMIEDYKGPGSYESSMRGSRFIGVGIDANAVKKAGDSDEAVKKEATKAIKGAKHMLLGGAEVEITSANDDEIVGTFAWTPRSDKRPDMKGGKFRAKVREPRR